MRKKPTGETPSVSPPFVLERFEYTRLGEELGLLRLLAAVADEPFIPVDADLIIGRGPERTSHPARACRVTPTESGLLWRASFAVPLEVVEFPEALFRFAALGAQEFLLPRPELAIDLVPTLAEIRSGLVRPGDVLRRAVAVFTALSVSGSYGTGVALASAHQDGREHSALVAAATAARTSELTAAQIFYLMIPVPGSHRVASARRSHPLASAAKAQRAVSATRSQPMGSARRARHVGSPSKSGSTSPAPRSNSSPSTSRSTPPAPRSKSSRSTPPTPRSHSSPSASRAHLVASATDPGRTIQTRLMVKPGHHVGLPAAAPTVSLFSAAPVRPGAPGPGHKRRHRRFPDHHHHHPAAASTPTRPRPHPRVSRPRPVAGQPPPVARPNPAPRLPNPAVTQLPSNPAAPQAAPSPIPRPATAPTPMQSLPSPAQIAVGLSLQTSYCGLPAQTQVLSQRATVTAFIPNRVPFAWPLAKHPAVPLPTVHYPKPHLTKRPQVPLPTVKRANALRAEHQRRASNLQHATLQTAADQPPVYLVPIYKAAACRYDVPWKVLAAINRIETDYGHNLSVSSAGAIGWMQFMPSTWSMYGVSADGRGQPNPYSADDAIFSAARYLAASGASTNLYQAIFAYNQADWYVDEVLTTAVQIDGGAPASALQIDAVSPVASLQIDTGPPAPVLTNAPQMLHAMVTMADLLLGKPYIWGGGHSDWQIQPGYDCSGFVSAVLHAGGYLTAPQTTETLPYQPGIDPGPGKYVTIYDRTGAGDQSHVIISLGGQFYESGGSALEGGGAGVKRITVPNPEYLASFNRQLHPTGL